MDIVTGVGEKSTAKRVETFDENSNANGFLLELAKSGKDGRKTNAYLTAVNPSAFKGYHMHKVRESNYVCLKGCVLITLYSISGKETHLLKPGDKLHIPINVPTGITGSSAEQAWLINFPDPAYDPKLKDEQIDFTQEEVEAWVHQQRLAHANTEQPPRR